MTMVSKRPGTKRTTLTPGPSPAKRERGEVSKREEPPAHHTVFPLACEAKEGVWG
jgi:hypothetical protein